VWEPGEKVVTDMKIYALKFKEEIIKIGTTEYSVTSDYRWESKGVRDHLTVVYGTFTEEGSIEIPKTVEEKEVV
jgi:hypothetical protein